MTNDEVLTVSPDMRQEAPEPETPMDPTTLNSDHDEHEESQQSISLLTYRQPRLIGQDQIHEMMDPRKVADQQNKV